MFYSQRTTYQVKRAAAIGIAMLMILQLLVLCASQSLAAAEQVVLITGSSVNVRSGVGTDYSTVGTAYKGRVYDYLGEGRDGSGKTWFKIQYTGSATGWVTSQYSKKVTISTESTQDYINSISAAYGAAGVQVAVIQNGTVTGTYNYGWATKDSAPMTADTKIRTASLSKVAVAVSAMKMQEQGIVDINANIGQYWDCTPYRAVTLKSLLSHTSTLKALSSSSTKTGTISQLTSSSSYNSGTVGSSYSWMYNNYAMGVAGSTLEAASGQTLDSYTKANVFSPLGMDASFFAGSLADTSKLATLYYPDGSVARSVATQKGFVAKSTICTSTSSFAGGLTCSAKDIAKMMAMLANDGVYNGSRILSADSVALMESRLFTKSENGGSFSQGLPLRYMSGMFGQSGLYYHTGNAYGVLALASYNPSSRNGVVILATGVTDSSTTPACGRDSVGIYNICSKISEYIYDDMSGASATTTTTTTTTTAFVPSVPAQSIEICEQDITLGFGESRQLTCTLTPADTDDRLTWSSSSSCVTVDESGKITASGYGTAVITARGTSAQATCTVTVEPDTGLEMLGASIRLIEPYGIRFGIQFTKGDFYNNADIVEYGTLIIPAAILGQQELTVDTASVLRIKAEKILSEDDKALVYTGVLIDIPDTFFGTDVTARGYVVYNDADGNECVEYTDTVTKNFSGVAQNAYNKYSAIVSPTEAELDILEKLKVLLGKNDETETTAATETTTASTTSETTAATTTTATVPVTTTTAAAAVTTTTAAPAPAETTTASSAPSQPTGE